MAYTIKVINRDRVELTFLSGELKFVADFYRNGNDWRVNGDDIKAECSGVEYEINPDFMLQNRFFHDDWIQIEGEIDYQASNWDGVEQ